MWELDGATERLVALGVYRDDGPELTLRPVTFKLRGNAWDLRPGTELVVEIVGNAEPAYQANNTPFTVRIFGIELSVPVAREALRRRRRRGLPALTARRGRAGRRSARGAEDRAGRSSIG